MNINAFVGGLLMVLGGLVATLSGGCGFVIIISTVPILFPGGAGNPELFNLLIMLGMIFGVPFALGCFVAYCGWKIVPGDKSKHDDVL